jgi:hypothetical protein
VQYMSPKYFEKLLKATSHLFDDWISRLGEMWSNILFI